MKKSIGILLCMLCTLSIGAQQMKKINRTNLCEGDLLFCAKEASNPITEVTQGVSGMKIDHVAIVHKQANKTYALETIHKGVTLTPMDSFMARREMVVAARLCDTLGVAQSVERALSFLGRPYDFNFMPSDSAFYCSELVQKNYRYSDGQLVFKPIAMSFHDKTGKITDYWKEYYGRQGLTVPEDEPGSNPGDLSRSKAIQILGIIH